MQFIEVCFSAAASRPTSGQTMTGTPRRMIGVLRALCPTQDGHCLPAAATDAVALLLRQRHRHAFMHSSSSAYVATHYIRVISISISSSSSGSTAMQLR